MVVIRLSRAGTKKKPFYHLAVADKRSPRDGRFIERVGFYNPIARGKSEPLRVDLARIDYWLSVGAQLSPKVRSIVARARILDALPPEPASTDSTDSSDIKEGEEAVTEPEAVVANAAVETTDMDAPAVDTESQEDLANQEAAAEANEVEAVEATVAEATDESDMVDQEESTVASTQEEEETVVDAADEPDTVNTTEDETSSGDATELSADTSEESVDEEVADAETDAASVEGDSTDDSPAEATDESESDSPSTAEDATEDQDKSA